jgi:hypothetical protein
MERTAPDEPLESLDWAQWQARKRAAYEADQRALRSGEKSREQLVEENGAVPAHIAQAPLSWNDLLW